MEKKPWYLSKTIWLNILAAAGIIVDNLSGANVIPEGKAVLALSIINGLLRMITKKAIRS